MSDSQRKLRIARPADIGQTASGRAASGAARCESTGLTIPECSCRRCATEQIRKHAPWVLGGGNDAGPGHAA